MFMLRGAADSDAGAWSARKYSSVPVFELRPPCLTSFTTPMMLNQGICSLNPGFRRRPTGLCVLKNVSYERLVDENRRCAADVGEREVATVNDRDAHRLQDNRA